MASEFEVLDARQHGLSTADVLEHPLVEVDRDDLATDRDERVRDASRPAAEVQDLRAGRHDRVDELGFARGTQDLVEAQRCARVALSGHTRPGSNRYSSTSQTGS